MSTKVLVIDDDPAIGRSLQLQLRAHGCEVECTTSARSGLEQAVRMPPDLVFLDLQLPDGDGLDLIPELLTLKPEPVVVVITGLQDMQATISAIRSGAFDYIRKPLDLDDILLVVAKASHRSSEEAVSVAISDFQVPPHEIVGKSRGIIEVLTKVARFSEVQVSVLIEGESGTGKELVARAIHEASAPSRPFVAVNCVALASGVWESEMFGHERGAFTGADRRHRGRLEVAEDGTVFLDEIGDLPLELQGKLLRVLQEREFERVGGTEAVAFRARIVAATHRDVRTKVVDGTFREDLLHRLEVARIHIPPLRNRREDIPLLVEALLRRIATAFNRDLRAIAEDVLRQLQQHDWPGNVRELENVLMRAVASGQDEVLSSVDLPDSIETGSRPTHQISRWRLRDAESEHIRVALEHFAWNISHTARALEVSPTTLRKKIKDYALHRQPST